MQPVKALHLNNHNCVRCLIVWYPFTPWLGEEMCVNFLSQRKYAGSWKDSNQGTLALESGSLPLNHNATLDTYSVEVYKNIVAEG